MLRSKPLLAICFLIAAGGFLLPFWPLTVVGVIIAGLSGHFVFALLLGLLLDVAYGAPVGPSQYLFFPLTIVALSSIVIRIVALRYFFDRSPENRL